VIPHSFAARVVCTVWLPIPALSNACTVCHSSTAQLVRAGIFNAGFFHTFGLVTLPVPILALAVVAVHFGMPDLALEQENADIESPARTQAKLPFPGEEGAD
jgi:hypothetical protein